MTMLEDDAPAIGETPGAQWRSSIEWLDNTRQASNWCLIGSDYVWPWLSHKAIKKYIADAGGRAVDEDPGRQTGRGTDPVDRC